MATQANNVNQAVQNTSQAELAGTVAALNEAAAQVDAGLNGEKGIKNGSRMGKAARK